MIRGLFKLGGYPYRNRDCFFILHQEPISRIYIKLHNPDLESSFVYLHQQAMSVHCLHGRGRTGTMLACYFVKKHNMSAAEAIAEVRHLRPGSVEVLEQEQLVHDYSVFINESIS